MKTIANMTVEELIEMMTEKGMDKETEIFYHRHAGKADSTIKVKGPLSRALVGSEDVMIEILKDLPGYSHEGILNMFVRHVLEELRRVEHDGTDREKADCRITDAEG